MCNHKKNAIMEIIALLSIGVNMLLLIQHVFTANHMHSYQVGKEHIVLNIVNAK